MLRESEQKILTELAFVRSIADRELDDNNIPNGRLKGLLLRLRKAVDQAIVATKLQPSKIDIAAIELKLNELQKKLGFFNNEFPITAMAGFCLCCLEDNEECLNIINILVDIVDYYERSGADSIQLKYKHGDLAHKTWVELFA